MSILRKLAAVFCAFGALGNLLFAIVALSDILAGDPKETGLGVLIGLMIFFGGLTLIFGYLSYIWGFRQNPHIQKQQERQILSLARGHQGRLTTALLAAESDLDLQESQQQLEQFVTQGFARMEVDDQGNISYVFSGLHATGQALLQPDIKPGESEREN